MLTNYNCLSIDEIIWRHITQIVANVVLPNSKKIDVIDLFNKKVVPQESFVK